MKYLGSRNVQLQAGDIPRVFEVTRESGYRAEMGQPCKAVRLKGTHAEMNAVHAFFKEPRTEDDLKKLLTFLAGEMSRHAEN